MLEPRRLLTFREVARRGSFSRAADALALTQPAVSQQVGALEREVGAPLLHRGPGGLTLTPEGELLLGHADAPAAGGSSSRRWPTTPGARRRPTTSSTARASRPASSRGSTTSPATRSRSA